MQGHCSPPLQQSIADTATQPSHIEVVHYPFSDESDIDDQQPSQRQSPSPTRLSKHEKQQKPAGCFGSSATETLAKEHIIMSGYLLKKGEQRRVCMDYLVVTGLAIEANTHRDSMKQSVCRHDCIQQ